MNANKAQEYFSLFFEGELEGGLREQFERTLRQDAQVQAEYKAFARTMQELEALKNPVPEPDFDLSEAISRRLDRHFYELDRKPANNMWTLWRKLAVGAIAVLAVVGTVASIWNANNGPSQAGPIAIPSSTTKPAPKKAVSMDATKIGLEFVGETWTLTATADESQTIIIRSAESANEKKVELGANDELTAPLINSGVMATIIEVQSTLAQNSVFVALPGSEMRTLLASGEGSISDFAKAICARRNVPVVVVAKSSGDRLAWSFEGELTAANLQAVVAKHNYTVEEKENGIIWIL